MLVTIHHCTPTIQHLQIEPSKVRKHLVTGGGPLQGGSGINGDISNPGSDSQLDICSGITTSNIDKYVEVVYTK
jgi:hypothetical protein